jgi:hypothetical protein
MAHRPFPLRIAALVAGALLAPPAAQAFTIDDGTGKGAIPKFDLGEQSRNFRKGDLDTPGANKREWETPVGKLQFGVQGNSPYRSNSDAANRRHFDRMLTPDIMRD